MLKKFSLLLALFSCFTIGSIIAQDNFDIFKFRNVGPSRGGRVTTVAGVASEPSTFYMGATGGGVWKTTDYGIKWSNVSDGYFETPSIGAIAVAQNDPNVVYVGTGSDGLRSNVISGKGIYKSIDAGKTWKHIGLSNTGHIGAVEIHPQNHNIAYVAAIGQAFVPNDERGIYKTTDGGKTWKKVLFISNEIGFADLEFLPGNPEVVYAAAWKARRKPWTIDSGGKEGGIYKSVDGGETWEKLSKGLPQGLIGKIDLAVSPADSRILYALVEAPKAERGLYKSIDQGESFTLVSNKKQLTDRPFYYCNVDVDPKNTDIVYVMSTAYWKSENGGVSWKRMSSPHGDNHDMWINPDNPDLFIQANDGGANVTHNGGKSWSTQFNQPTTEIYQVEVDNQHPYWLYGGAQDNYTTLAVPSMAPDGLQDAPTGWIINTGGCETGPAVPSPINPDIVYANCKGRFSVYNKRTGLEKRYDVGAANMYGHNPKDLKYRFQRVAPIHISPHDPKVVYHASQYLHKTTDDGQTWETISPDLTAFESDKQVISGRPLTRDITGEEFYSTIYSVQESKVEKGLIWVGANDGPVHVTRDGGKNWNKVTPPKMPTGGRVDAVEPSPHKAAKAYISILRYQLGDWKPYIYRTNDYGKKWQLITNRIPENYPVRVIREDPNREGLLYAGTEFGLFISFDDGQNWKSFQQNLPITPITDIKIHRNDLVLSTMGRSFWILDNLSTLHQGAFDQLAEKPELFAPRDTYLYQFPKVRQGPDIVPKYPRPSAFIDYYLSEKQTVRLDIMNDQGRVVNTFLSDSLKTSSGGSTISRDMGTNVEIYRINKKLKSTKGIHRFEWDMRHFGPWDKKASSAFTNGPRVSPGIYTAKLTVGDQVIEKKFELLIDPRLNEEGTSIADIEGQEAFLLKLADLLSEAKRLAMATQKKLKELKAKSKTSDMSDEDKNLHEELKSMKKKLITEQGIYPQPMLVDQIAYLYYLSNGASQKPGKDALDRYDELKAQLDTIRP
ncbi:MAG: hypothetical protein AAFN93_02305 [Bacteroidota bacterium]